MRVIIAGSRNIIDWALDHTLKAIIDSGWGNEITEVVCGEARGIDWCGKQWAIANEIPVKPFPYKGKYGKAGGMIRNTEMSEYADALIAIWDGKSKGTLDMITKMRLLNKPVFVRKVELDGSTPRKN